MLKVGDRVKVTKVEEALHSAGRNFWKVGDEAVVIEPNECSGGTIVYIGQKGDSWKEAKAAFGTGGLELVKFKAGDKVRVIDPKQATYSDGEKLWKKGVETRIFRLNMCDANLVYLGDNDLSAASFNMEGLELIKEEKKMGWGKNKAVVEEEKVLTEEVAIEEGIALWTRIVEMGGLDGDMEKLDDKKTELCESLLGERHNGCPLCEYSKKVMDSNCAECPYNKGYGKCSRSDNPFSLWGSAKEGEERLKYALDFLSQLYRLRYNAPKDAPKVEAPKLPEPKFKIGDRVKLSYDSTPFIITRVLWAEKNGEYDWGCGHKHWHYGYENKGGILDAFWLDESTLELAPQEKWKDVTREYTPEIKKITGGYYLRLKSPDGNRDMDISLWQGSMHYEGGMRDDLKVELAATPRWKPLPRVSQVKPEPSFPFKILKRDSKS